jgi:hypothetical protein
LKTLKRLSILLGETAFAIALVVGICFAAAYNKRVPFLAILLIGQTAIVFGYVLKNFRIYWRNPRFWVWLSMIFVFHLAGVALLIQYGEHLRFVYIGFLAFLEYFGICMLLDRLLFWFNASKHPH